jgi:LacI family transcriptional regulator
MPLPVRAANVCVACAPITSQRTARRPRRGAAVSAPRPRSGAPTVYDVAAAAGVTAAVVSRVLNGDETLRVRQDTRDRVLAAVKTLRYTPNNSARALRTASSGAICLLVNDVGSPIHAMTLRGAQASAESSRRVVLLMDAQEVERHPDRLRIMVDSRRVDGLVMHLSGVESDRAMQRVAASRMPTVIINSKTRGPAGSVSLDDTAAARLATEHLLDLGHTRIAMITGLPGSDRSERRTQGVRMALADRGVSLPEEWVLPGGFDEPRGHAAGLALLARRRRPTAVVVANVVAGVGMLGACRDMGVRVPDELSVIALLDIWFCDHTSPPLTVVDMPIQEMGARAFELVVDMIEGKPRRSIVLRDPHPRLVLRKSTAPPPPA